MTDRMNHAPPSVLITQTTTGAVRLHGTIRGRDLPGLSVGEAQALCDVLDRAIDAAAVMPDDGAQRSARIETPDGAALRSIAGGVM